MPRLRLALGLALFALAARAPGAVRAGDDEEVAAIVRDLESPKFAVRRAAERALYLEGSAILSSLAAGDATVDARIAAFERALAGGEGEQTPAAAQAVARISARLDEAASDGQVRRIPRLLRARLARLVPAVVLDRDAPEERRDGAKDAYRSVRDLLPEARPLLVEQLRTTEDPRALAGTLAILCAEDGSGPDVDGDLGLIGAAYEHDPSRFRDVFRFESGAGAPPVMALALALAMTGRTASLREISIREALRSESLRTWLEPRLERRGAADLAMGGFLVRLEEGRASADDEAEGARRAQAVGLPWLARLLARRALFLAPSSDAAKATLLAASTAVGIRTAARRDGRASAGSGAAPGEPADDAAAIAIDDALRAGRLSQRLAYQIETGSDARAGLVATAIGGGRLAHSAPGRRTRVVDATTGGELYTFPSASRLPTRALALQGDTLAEVTDRGALVLWALGATEAMPLRSEAGSFQAVVAGRDGFWLAGFGLTIHRATKDGVERMAKVPRVAGFVPQTLCVFRDETLLVASADAAVRVDPVSGAMARVELPPGSAGVVACGDDVLVAVGGELVRIDREGRRSVTIEVGDAGAILGLAAERDGSTAYVQTIDALHAIDPVRGVTRWVEHVEGSGDPVVGDGVVAARAGRGSSRLRGDGRADRTIFVVRAAGTLVDPFGPAEHAKIVSLATAAAAEGRRRVARVVVDPVWTWLSADERAAVEVAIDAAPDAAPRDGTDGERRDR